MWLDAVLVGIGVLALLAIGGIFMLAEKIVRWASAQPPTSGDDREPVQRAGPSA